MSQSSHLTSHELTQYVINLGKHINELYSRYDSLESQLGNQTQAINELHRSFDAIKQETIEFLVKSIKQLPTINPQELPPLPSLTNSS